MLDDILFFSFYTQDAYYEECAKKLKSKLDLLGAKYRIEPFIKPDGVEWPDICRKKIPFMQKIFKECQEKRLVWIDVDCSINRIPDFIIDYNADLMAFRRGFPHSHSAKPQRTRYWEPCFIVFNKNSKMENFLDYAAQLESEKKDIKATDDYFFEEAWRKFKTELTVFEIPGEFCSRHFNTEFSSFKRYQKYIFFEFGASGFVNQYKGKCIQHRQEKHIFSEIKKYLFNIFRNNHVEKKNKAVIAQNKIEKYIRYIRKDGIENINSIESIQEYGLSENEREQMKALFSYEKKKNNIPLHWFIRPAPGNMGDFLSPYIVSKVTHFGVSYRTPPHAKLFAIGSIGKLVGKGAYAWGTGISTEDTPLNPEAHWLAVRGPYTRAAVLRNGGHCPEIYGDPGCLIKYFYKPKTKRQKGHFGLVRHYVHQVNNVQLSEDIDDINILVSTKEHLENFLDRLNACEAVLTSSLHVTILCHAYHIPCRLITFEGSENAVSGDGIKWKDYFEGAGMKLYNMISIGNKLTGNDIVNLAIDEYPYDDYGKELIPALKNAMPFGK